MCLQCFIHKPLKAFVTAAMNLKRINAVDNELKRISELKYRINNMSFHPQFEVSSLFFPYSVLRQRSSAQHFSEIPSSFHFCNEIKTGS